VNSAAEMLAQAQERRGKVEVEKRKSGYRPPAGQGSGCAARAKGRGETDTCERLNWSKALALKRRIRNLVMGNHADNAAHPLNVYIFTHYSFAQ